ncbi:winged helix-turn-helix domain-containing protein [Serratia fonticola]|uniref:winged helix-turn-helix domain-containing protein n=1 Tax=Serratia fonticola TaxID=47917 RepID=UPI001AE56315|nr:winged helix-turn-helix domain-containing protein [Serratia fonticola]MBP1038839.1 winged helix-turn-helix domain-containing protein [Serratia fonticola]
MKYKINGYIIFEPEHKILYDENNHSLYVILQVSACRLLCAFIENQDNVLSRDFLLKKVWSDNGYAASLGNLNNNISVLRRAFLHLNTTSAIISTIPKVGFKLDSKYIQTQGSEELTTKDLARDVTLPPLDVDIIGRDKKSDITTVNAGEDVKYSLCYRVFKIKNLLIFALFYLVVAYTVYYFYDEEVETVFIYNMCTIHNSTSNALDKSRSKEDVLSLLKAYSVDCSKTYKDVFISERELRSINKKILLVSFCEAYDSSKKVYSHCLNTRVTKNRS